MFFGTSSALYHTDTFGWVCDKESHLNSPFMPQKSSRRSQRILLNIGIIVQGVRSNGKKFSEKTHTLVVNAHGALIRLLEPVEHNQQITITNIKTNEESACRVAGVLSSQSGEPEVGIEFSEASPRFWRVAFPPEDWSPRNPEAKRTVKPTQVPVKPAVKAPTSK
jgi:hypothetical protein